MLRTIVFSIQGYQPVHGRILLDTTRSRIYENTLWQYEATNISKQDSAHSLGAVLAEWMIRQLCRESLT
jgi:hypothetical protein